MSDSLVDTKIRAEEAYWGVACQVRNAAAASAATRHRTTTRQRRRMVIQ